MRTYLDSQILKIGPLVQKLPIMAHVSKRCPIFGGPILPYTEKVPFFIFSILSFRPKGVYIAIFKKIHFWVDPLQPQGMAEIVLRCLAVLN